MNKKLLYYFFIGLLLNKPRIIIPKQVKTIDSIWNFEIKIPKNVIEINVAIIGPVPLAIG